MAGVLAAEAGIDPLGDDVSGKLAQRLRPRDYRTQVKQRGLRRGQDDDPKMFRDQEPWREWAVQQATQHYGSAHSPGDDWAKASARLAGGYTPEQLAALRPEWEERQDDLTKQFQLARKRGLEPKDAWARALDEYAKRDVHTELAREEEFTVPQRFLSAVSRDRDLREFRRKQALAKNDLDALRQLAAQSTHVLFELMEAGKSDDLSSEERQLLHGEAARVRELLQEDMAKVGAGWSETNYDDFLIEVAAQNAPFVKDFPAPMRTYIAQSMRDEVGAKVTEQQAETIQAFDRYLESTEFQKESGFLDWVTENWQTLLLPAGVIAMFFGGNIGKVVGVLAAAVGGMNLYDRISTLTGDPAKNPDTAMSHAAIKHAMSQVDDKGGPTPFSNINAAAEAAVAGVSNPTERAQRLATVQRSLRDMQVLIRLGFGESITNRIREQVKESANTLGRTVFGIGLTTDTQAEPAASEEAPRA
jgi:hypothetical protein